MMKQDVYKQEFEKLSEIFLAVDENKRKLVEGLIVDAAFLKAENFELRLILEKTGMVKIHPKQPGLQKPIPAAKEYRQNLNAYSVVIKTLNGILSKDLVEEDNDELEEYE